jgi:hypothetical protein
MLYFQAKAAGKCINDQACTGELTVHSNTNLAHYTPRPGNNGGVLEGCVSKYRGDVTLVVPLKQFHDGRQMSHTSEFSLVSSLRTQKLNQYLPKHN